ncbi:MAG: ABC transporter ATP-binding protein [Firmicutes bacterium]|jgi:peptide/nickel transport system ATP-binding protein|nr:ABC transporter ATP-binding protein [Bacillota bacterium]
MPTRHKLLSINDVTKVFTIGGGFQRARLKAVEKASFALEEGKPEIFTLAGESGCGKTTLAKMILGLLEPTDGEVLHSGRSVQDLVKGDQRDDFNKKVQAVFQNPFETFNPLRPVDTYLLETARNYVTGGSNGASKNAVAEALDLVGISYSLVEDRYPHEFSGGQLQRISIARALITAPSLIIADEPVSMVDASLKMSVCNLFKVLKEEHQVNVIYITHDLATAYYVSDRIAIMFRGNIVELGPVNTVLVEPKHPYTRVLKDSVPEPDPSNKWSGRIKLSGFEERDFMRKGCKFAGRCPEVKAICEEEDPPMVAIGSGMVKCHLYAR